MKTEKTASAEEWRLMTLLWEEPRTLTQLVEALKEEKGWAKSTVATMLSRMEKKGLVCYEEQGRARKYLPAADREKVAVKETRRFLQRVYQGSVGMMVNSLVQEKELNPQEIHELYEILREAEKQ